MSRLLSCGVKIGCRLQGTCERLLAMFRSDLDPLGGNEFEVVDADETEHPAQIGFHIFARRGRRTGPIESAARDRDDDALVAGQAFRALRAIFESLARHHDAVDPGLELA